MFHFDVSEEVGVLLISIFVAGYCLGPLVSRQAVFPPPARRRELTLTVG